MHWENKKFMCLDSLQCLLCGGLEPNLQYLQGKPVFSPVLFLPDFLLGIPEELAVLCWPIKPCCSTGDLTLGYYSSVFIFSLSLGDLRGLNYELHAELGSQISNHSIHLKNLDTQQTNLTSHLHSSLP